jgi:hypothetical protein
MPTDPMYDDVVSNPTMNFCIWEEDDGHYWDDAEDHGGYDRISPIGPFTNWMDAYYDLCKTFPDKWAGIHFRKPYHYD